MTAAAQGRTEAGRAVWLGLAPKAGRRGSRLFRGLRRVAGTAFLGGILAARGHETLAVLAVAAGVLTALLAVCFPSGWVRLERRSARAVGAALAWLLLVPAYFLFVTPFGLLGRRGRRDRLGRRPDPSAHSYFVRCGGPTSLERPY